MEVGCLALLAVAGVLPAGARAQARDSAGVTIIDNRIPAWGAKPQWRIAPKPMLVISSGTGSDSLEFGNVEAVALTADGSVLIGDNQNLRILRFAADGKYLRRYGRKGSGPGEFEQILFVATLTGDSVAGIGFPATSLFEASGRFARQVRPSTDGAGGVALALGRTNDGIWIGARFGSQTGAPVGSEWFDSMTVLRISAEGGKATALTSHPSGRHRADPRYGEVLLAFTSTTWATATANGYCTGWSEKFVIECYDWRGRPTRSIRRAVLPAKPKAADLEQARTQLLEGRSLPGVPTDARASRQRKQQAELMVAAPTFPFFREFRFDPTGALWVRLFDRDADLAEAFGGNMVPARATRWSVFDPRGVWLGDVQLPAGFRALDFGTDRVAGVSLGADDMEEIRVYRIDGR